MSRLVEFIFFSLLVLVGGRQSAFSPTFEDDHRSNIPNVVEKGSRNLGTYIRFLHFSNLVDLFTPQQGSVFYQNLTE